MLKSIRITSMISTETVSNAVCQIEQRSTCQFVSINGDPKGIVFANIQRPDEVHSFHVSKTVAIGVSLNSSDDWGMGTSR